MNSLGEFSFISFQYVTRSLFIHVLYPDPFWYLYLFLVYPIQFSISVQPPEQAIPWPRFHHAKQRYGRLPVASQTADPRASGRGPKHNA